MKKLLVIVSMVLGLNTAQAQSSGGWNDQNILTHFGVGVGVGFSGLTIDVGSDITDYLTLRGGVDIFPSVKLDFDIETGFEGDFSGVIPSRYQQPDGDIKVKSGTALGGGHLLLDIHPFKTSFRITTGLYFGNKDAVTVDTKDNTLAGMANWNTDVYDYTTQLPKTGTQLPADLQAMALSNGGTLPRFGAEIGDYFLEPKADGTVSASFRVNSVRPYLGLGFGRMVPKKSRLTCNFDLGVQFWGTPSVYLQGRNGDMKLTKSNFTDSEGSEALDYLSKITVWPQLTIRLVGRIF